LLLLRTRFRNEKFSRSVDALKSLGYLLSFADVFEKADAASYSCIHQSALNKTLSLFTEDNSVNDVSSNLICWSVVVNICLKLSQNPNLVPLLRPKVQHLPQWIKAHLPLLDRLVEVEKQLSHVGKDVDEAIVESLGKIHADLVAIKANVAEFDKTFSALNFSSPDEKYDETHAENKVDDAAATRTRLVEYLRTLQFETVDMSADSFRFTAEVTESAGQAPNKSRLMRIKKELAILSHALPDGIFVRVNEARPDMIKVLITGPGDTPYENGLFIFDVFLPIDFPAMPPKMRMLTTGTGYRFNPNLYTDGYVCLSLLGTWQGPGWDPENSTLLQLVVSVQAMILCEEPYCNEPGWYSSVGSDESKHYNKQLRQATSIYAMLWHLNGQHPVPKYFENIVNGHFFMRKEELKAQLNNWEETNNKLSGSRTCYGGEMNLSQTWELTKPALVELVNKLEDPSVAAKTE